MGNQRKILNQPVIAITLLTSKVNSTIIPINQPKIYVYNITAKDSAMQRYSEQPGNVLGVRPFDN